MAEVTGGGAHVPDRAGAKSAILEFLHGLQLPPYQFGYATGHEETLARRVGSTSPPRLHQRQHVDPFFDENIAHAQALTRSKVPVELHV